MSNGMAALSREDTKPQSLADAHCSSAAQYRCQYRTQDLDAKWILHLAEFR